MFEKFRLVQITKNTEGGEAQEITAYDTEKACVDAFYTKCDKIGTNPATAIVELIILDSNGGMVRKEVIDNTKYAV